MGFCFKAHTSSSAHEIFGCRFLLLLQIKFIEDSQKDEKEFLPTEVLFSFVFLD
jgi:hypothetical protein